MLSYSQIVALDKNASLSAGIASARKPSGYKIKPWRDGPDEAMAAASPGHSGRSTSSMGCKTAVKMPQVNFKAMMPKVPSFNMPNATFGGAMSGLKQQATKAINGAALVGDAAMGKAKPWMAQQAQNAGRMTGQAYGAAKPYAKPVALGAAGATALGGAGMMGANAIGNYGQGQAVGHIVNALGGEGQVRDLMTSMGVPIDANTPIGQEHLQAGIAKMKEMQKAYQGGPWNQISSWWQGLNPQLQQAIMGGVGSAAVGGLLGGPTGFMAGGLAGAAAPYAYNYISQHMNNGLATPSALN